MKVILVNGSPKEKGCTYTALCEVEKALRANGVETEIFWLGKDALAGCIGCGACGKMGKCFRGDCVNDFVEKAKEEYLSLTFGVLGILGVKETLEDDDER